MRDPLQIDIHICFTDWRWQFHTTWLSVHVLLTGTTQLLSADMTQRARPCHTDHSVIECWHDSACTSLSHGTLSYWVLTWLSVDVLVTRTTQLLSADMTQRARPCHTKHSVIGCWHDSALTSLSHEPLSYWGCDNRQIPLLISAMSMVYAPTRHTSLNPVRCGQPCRIRHPRQHGFAYKSKAVDSRSENCSQIGRKSNGFSVVNHIPFSILNMCIKAKMGMFDKTHVRELNIIW